ncbi:MAG: DUF3592 domain-containing protein [bacterium]|nr:DUF3592 domain-containing protein [bacterium]
MAISFGRQPHQITRQNPVQLFIFALVFVIVGGATLFIWGIPTIQKAYESKNWPSVQGTITVSNFVTDRSTNSDGSDATTYKADIGYDYILNGQTHSGSDVSFGAYSSSNASEMRSIVNRYPLGKSVAVYYNPKDPNASVLEPGANLGSFLAAGIGALFFILGIVMAVQALKGKPKTANQQQQPTPPTQPAS